MPISKNVDNIAATELGNSLSPLIKNNYRLALIFPPPIVSNPKGFPEANQAAINAATASGGNSNVYDSYFKLMAGNDASLAQDLAVFAGKLRDPNNPFPMEVEFSPPNISTETRTVRRGNINIKYAGFPDVGESFMTFNNFVELRLALFLRCWYQMSAGISRTPQSPGGMLPGRPQFISRVAPQLYKVNGFLYQYGNQSVDNDLQDLVPSRVYELYGVYVNTLTMGTVDNSNSGDLQELRVQFSIDYFQADSSGSSYETEELGFNDKNIESLDESQLDNIDPNVTDAFG